MDPASLQTCSHSYAYTMGWSHDYRCSMIAQDYCAPQTSFINFYSLFFCTFDGQLWSMAILAPLLIFLIFRYTKILVEEYVEVGVSSIVKSLEMSPSLATVTLMAFASGSAAFISAIVAGGAEGGVEYNLGGLYGAGLFIGALVIPVCAIKSVKTYGEFFWV
jgi:hypothetical protein